MIAASARHRDRWLIAGGCLALALMVLWRAAVCEDAYITFRVVDNVVHGFGLRWNIDERVQAYTNPLWMLLHIPFYALWENIFYITLGLSFVATGAAIALILRYFPKPAWPTLGLFLIPLTVSLSFTDYATSGLENPLTYLLFTCFCCVLLRAEKRFWFWITLCFTLNLVNRLDTLIFYAPVMGWLAVTRFRSIRWGECILGSLPIILWEGFSLFYYGFLFPNTKYAKLNAGVPQSEYIAQGLRYIANLAMVDITSVIFMSAAMVWLLSQLFTEKKMDRARSELLGIGAGILLYTLYVIAVGGNHVSGRFWSLPVFASIWLVYMTGQIGKRACLCVIMGVVFVRGFYPDIGTLKGICPDCFNYKIYITGGRFTLVDQLTKSQPLPEVNRNAPPAVVQFGGLGFYGYKAGPSVHIVDYFALSDALLARLPSRFTSMIRIGHFTRPIPKGYMEALKTGSTKDMDPALVQYYDKLRILIAGDLWSLDRLEEIVKFNRGDYDYLRDQYVAHSAIKR